MNADKTNKQLIYMFFCFVLFFKSSLQNYLTLKLIIFK